LHYGSVQPGFIHHGPSTFLSSSSYLLAWWIKPYTLGISKPIVVTRKSMSKQFGNWEVIGNLSEGGQGWVYRVRNMTTGQEGALKRLKKIMRQPRFIREVQAVNKISHENIVHILDSDTQATKPFIVFELIVGRALGEISPEELEQTPLTSRMEWFIQVCRGVRAAHSNKVWHRDLKPENIMINNEGKVKICDFGLAFVDEAERLTETQEQIGSRFYIAPECEGGRTDQVSEAIDIYSLGKILYYLLSPGKIFPRELYRDPRYDLAKVREDPYMERFNRILDSMVRENPEEREKDIDALAKRIRSETGAYLQQLPVAGVSGTYKCLFCGIGTYQQVAPKESASQHNLGYFQEGNIGNEQFAFLECSVCGNSQRFKMKYDSEGWFDRS
jgi:serine/threonine protein kinase